MSGQHPWPMIGFMTILGAESQEAVFVPRALVERHLVPGSLLLSNEEGQHWLSDSEVGSLRNELIQIAERAGPGEDTSSVVKAIALVDYEIGERTGVAIVPPPHGPRHNDQSRAPDRG